MRPLRRNRQLDAIFDYAKNKLIERSDFHTRAPDSAERQYLFMVYLYNRIFAVRRSCVCVKANRIIATISRTGKLNKTLRLRCPGNDWITKYCDRHLINIEPTAWARLNIRQNFACQPLCSDIPPRSSMSRRFA